MEPRSHRLFNAIPAILPKGVFNLDSCIYFNITRLLLDFSFRFK